jgi:hypothetical protein
VTPSEAAAPFTFRLARGRDKLARIMAGVQLMGGRLLMHVFATFFLLLTMVPASTATERVRGFLTFGCESYLRPSSAAETWSIELSNAQRFELLAKANVTKSDRSLWTTLYVDVVGQVVNEPRHGYTGLHAKRFRLERILSARSPNSGETVEAAFQAARRYEGFLLASQHGFGFVPFEYKDEFWWLLPGKIGWPGLVKYAPQDDGFAVSQIVVLGRVGPPGAYGHLDDYNREIAADELQFVRLVKPEELIGTAGVSDPNAPWGGIPAINRCAAPSSVTAK